jgi:hypothetical protein
MALSAASKIQGPLGPTGPTGYTGYTGYTGPSDGPIGPTGPTGPGGGGSSWPYVNLVPVPPDLAGWGWVNLPGASENLTNGVLTLSTTSTGGYQMHWFGQALPAPPWTVICAYAPPGPFYSMSTDVYSAQSGNWYDGLCLWNSDTSFLYLSHWLGGQMGMTIESYNETPGLSPPYSDPGFVVGGHDVTSGFPPLIWYKAHFDDVTYDIYTSLEPASTGWLRIWSATHHTFLGDGTPKYNHAGWAINTGNMEAGHDFTGGAVLSWSVTDS